MQKIRIITVGKLKNSSLKKEVEELLKRISRIEIIELKEIKDKNSQIVKKKELETLKPYIESSPQTILLWEHGKQYTTKGLYEKVSLTQEPIDFIITGALGPSEELISLVNSTLSLSLMTFTHEQAFYMLIEQLYRCECFEKNIPYTK